MKGGKEKMTKEQEKAMLEAMKILTFLSKNSPIFYKWEMNC